MRKVNQTFYFSVEGQTEQQYIQWLQKVINSSSEALCHVKLNVKVEKNPLSYIKQLNNISKVDVMHLFDYESSDIEHQRQFDETLHKMRKASSAGKKVTYLLGYSNFTFELWMILHKNMCRTQMTDRTQYLSEINHAFGKNFKSLSEYKHHDNFEKILDSLTIDDVRDAIERSELIMSDNKNHNYSLQKSHGYEFYRENPSLSINDCIKKVLDSCGLV
ncbi:RloB domain-containing protein [uncultured Gemmiger sp.]|uniref:RloB domain-containing protein n=1 Tax=uncultured Gemmiger sp. TaxID=1623490 RepID=UPI00259233CB|nr:RloB domain-containing protein [uncultured Gemmiger sp.]